MGRDIDPGLGEGHDQPDDDDRQDHLPALTGDEGIPRRDHGQIIAE